MKDVYVVDPYSLASLDSLCIDPPAVHALFSVHLTDMVEDGVVVFPDETYQTCARHAPDGLATLWARSVKAVRRDVAVPSRFLESVLSACPGLVDQDDPYEQAGPVVAALALYRKGNPELSVHIVSDETLSDPLRLTMHEAAPQFGVSVLTMREFMATNQLQHFLR